jgi:hypothetical protein
MANYTFKEKKQGVTLLPMTINLNPALVGGSICANFKKEDRGMVVFTLNFTMSEDGLTATSDELVLDFPEGRYYADITAISAEGKEYPLSRFLIPITYSTC